MTRSPSVAHSIWPRISLQVSVIFALIGCGDPGPPPPPFDYEGTKTAALARSVAAMSISESLVSTRTIPSVTTLTNAPTVSPDTNLANSLNGGASAFMELEEVTAFDMTKDWERKVRIAESGYKDLPTDQSFQFGSPIVINSETPASAILPAFTHIESFLPASGGRRLGVVVHRPQEWPNFPPLPYSDTEHELSRLAEQHNYPNFSTLDPLPPLLSKQKRILALKCADYMEIFNALAHASEVIITEMGFAGFDVVGTGRQSCGSKPVKDTETFQRALYLFTMHLRNPALKPVGVVDLYLDPEGPEIKVSASDTWDTILPQFLALDGHRGHLVVE